MIGRRVSDQRPSRKGQVGETLLKAKEKLVNATSEVTASSSRLIVRSDSLWRKYFFTARVRSLFGGVSCDPPAVSCC